MIYITPEGNLLLKTHEGINFISINNILYLKAEGAYTRIFIEDGINLIICKNLIGFEKLLQENDFIRIHRSFLINIEKVSFFESKNRVVNIQANKIPISKRKSEMIYKLLLSNGINDGKNHCLL